MATLIEIIGKLATHPSLQYQLFVTTGTYFVSVGTGRLAQALKEESPNSTKYQRVKGASILSTQLSMGCGVGLVITSSLQLSQNNIADMDRFMNYAFFSTVIITILLVQFGLWSQVSVWGKPLDLPIAPGSILAVAIGTIVLTSSSSPWRITIDQAIGAQCKRIVDQYQNSMQEHLEARNKGSAPFYFAKLKQEFLIKLNCEVDTLEVSFASPEDVLPSEVRGSGGSLVITFYIGKKDDVVQPSDAVVETSLKATSAVVSFVEASRAMKDADNADWERISEIFNGFDTDEKNKVGAVSNLTCYALDAEEYARYRLTGSQIDWKRIDEDYGEKGQYGSNEHCMAEAHYLVADIAWYAYSHSPVSKKHEYLTEARENLSAALAKDPKHQAAMYRKLVIGLAEGDDLDCEDVRRDVGFLEQPSYLQYISSGIFRDHPNLIPDLKQQALATCLLN